MVMRYPRISNIPNMQVPKTDADVWDVLERGSQIADNTVQRSQNLQAAALAAILNIVNSIGTGSAGMTEEHLEVLTDCVRMLTMGFSTLNQVRKEIIRNALQYPIAKFCTAEAPVGTETLFIDLTKKLSERDTTKAKLVKKRSNSGGYSYNK